MKYYFENGWTCISCGDEYLKDIYGHEIYNYEEGTICKKCTKDKQEENNE